MDEPARSSTPPKWANPDHFDVLGEPAEPPQPAAAAPVNPIITNDPFTAFNQKVATSPLAKMPEVNLPEQPAVPDVTRPIAPVKEVTPETTLPVAKDVPSRGVFANETPTLISNIREGKFEDAAALAKENVMGSKPMRFLFGPTERQQIAESVPVKKEGGTTGYEYKPLSTDAVEKLGVVGAARRSISSLERGVPVTELDKTVEGEMFKDEPGDSTLKSIGKGLYNAVNRTVVAFSDPTMALIPESKLISGAFTLDMANSAKEQIQKGLEADTPQGAVEGLLGGVITLGMAGMSGKHTLKPTKADIIEHMDKVPDELLHEAQKELKESSPDVASAAGAELIKRAADFGQELNGVLQRLPGDVQDKVNGILQKQLSGDELTPNERTTLLQVRSYASRLKEEQSNAEFTSGKPAPTAPLPPAEPAAPVGTGGQSVSPRTEPVPDVAGSQQGVAPEAVVREKAAAAAQPLRAAAAAAEEVTPLAAQAAKEQADLLEKRAQEQAKANAAEPPSPPPAVEPPAQGQQEPPIAAAERTQATEAAPAAEGAAAKNEPGTRIEGPILQHEGKTYAEGKIGQEHKDLIGPALEKFTTENPDAEIPNFEHKFVDDKGNIHDRESAWQVAEKAGQIPEDTASAARALAGEDQPQLHSNHLITDDLPTPTPETEPPAVERPVATPSGAVERIPAADAPAPETPVERSGLTDMARTDEGAGVKPKTRLDQYVEAVQKTGREMTIDVTDATPESLRKIMTALEGKEGVDASTDGRFVLLRPKEPPALLESKASSSKEGSLLDRLESLLTEEEQPKAAEEPPQSPAAKRVADIQRDIENNANAEPAWKRRRQKDLKTAQKALAEEQVGAPAPEPAAELPAEKQNWQKTRDEVKAEGGILTKHRIETRAAVERGDDVPLDVLEDYSGYHWADKARREKYGEQVSDSLLTRIIDSLKDEGGKLHFDPLFIQSVGKPALRGAVKLIREAVEAGGLAKDVLNDVVAYIKKNRPEVDEFDVRGFFEPLVEEALGKQEIPAEDARVGNESPSSTPSEPEPTPEQPTGSSRMVDEGGRELTSTKNAIVDRERQRRGEPPILSEAKKSLGTTWDEAMNEFAKNPKAGEDLVAELNKKPRAVTAKEEAVMLREKVDVMNELTKATQTALNEGADPADRVEARVRSAVLMDQLNSIDEATRKAGTEWGRTGRFRQMLAAEDYSLSRMMQKKQLALGEKWEKMSDEEKAKVNAETQKMSERIASLEKQLAEHEANHAQELERVRNEEADKAIQKMQQDSTPVLKVARRIVEKWKAEADAARSSMGSLFGAEGGGVGGVGGGKGGGRKLGQQEKVEQSRITALAKIIRAEVAESALDLAEVTAKLVSEFGDKVAPYIDRAWATANTLIEKEDGAAKAVRQARVTKSKDPAEQRQNLVNRIAEKNKKGARESIGGSIQKLAESFVRQGITEREPLIDAVHGALKEALPEATRKDIRDAISGYGQFKELSKDEAKVVLRDLKGQMQQISKIEDMTERGQLPAKTGVQHREPSAEERQLLKEVNKIKKELGLESTDANQLKSALDAAKTRTRNRIEDLQRAIEKKEKIPKSDKKLQDDDELRDLKAQKDALQKEYDAVFETPKKTPEEIALAAYKARTKARIEELNDRTKRGDFSKKERKSMELDPEGVKLRAEAERAKLEFDKALYRDKQQNMPMTQRILDYIPKIARANLLSNPITLAKLTAAALLRMGATPFEELVGGGLGKLPFVSEVAARAPREGGFNTKAEAKALTDAWMKGMKDARDKLFKGETDLDVTGGKRNVIPHHWLDIFGSMHGALKAPVVRAEFARSFEKRTAHAAANGIDITDPAVQIRIGLEAYRDSQRAIFQQDNRVVQIWNTAMRQLEQPSKVTGRVSLGNKALQTVAKTIFPIVKIPTNIVAEAFQYATGTVTGSARLAKAFKSGIETLKPEEADLIMRELKKGTLGSAVMLLGFFASQAIGGFYQPGQRRKDGDVKPGTVRVGNVDIPSYLLHNPLVDQLQVGATIGRVANSKLRHKDRETQGLPAGVAAAALGLIEEVPFATGTEQMHKLFTPNERMDYVGELARSRVEPQFMQWVAQQGDRASYIPPSEVRQRKPESFGQEMEMGIPGLRQNVPLKRKRSWR